MNPTERSGVDGGSAADFAGDAATDSAIDFAADAAIGDAADHAIDADGWCAAARRLPSPNCDARSDDVVTDLLIIHNISLPPGQFGGHYIEDLFLNRLDHDADPYFDQLRALRVSAHFLIRRDGSLLQFVPTVARAWHAGVSRFGERERCNDFSIGIELEGTDVDPFMPAQYATLAALTAALEARHRLTDVAGHEHVAPGRKTDPGPCFDWLRYLQLYRSVRHARHTTLPALGDAIGDAIGVAPTAGTDIGMRFPSLSCKP